MKSFVIPRKFNLMGRTITVEYSQEEFHGRDSLGTTCYRDDKIIISKYDGLGWKRTQQQLEMTFLHEILHWVLYIANGGVGEMHRDEALVDRMAGLIREILLQVKFDG